MGKIHPYLARRTSGAQCRRKKSMLRVAISFLALVSAPRLSAQAGLGVLPTTEIDLCAFPSEVQQLATFTLTNATDRTVRIGKAESCCAFIEPVLYEMTIPPGASIPLDVYVDGSSLNGAFRKRIELTVASPENSIIELWVRGTAQPAINMPSPYVFAGWTALNQPWSTNIAITVREGLGDRLVASASSNMGLECDVSGEGKTYQLRLRLPPQDQPIEWAATIKLGIEGGAGIPAVVMQVSGAVGASLHPRERTIALSGSNADSARFRLERRYPPGGAENASALSTTTPGVSMDETSVTPGQSIVTLRFDEAFLKRLKTHRRIPLKIQAEGFIPASLMIEYAP